jgi:predicted nucleic acid-binding OB-fold protein
MITTAKSGVVEFKNQREIIADRQRKTDQEYRDLQKRVGTILKTNYHIVQSVKSTN